jgi:hypothetical protein
MSGGSGQGSGKFQPESNGEYAKDGDVPTLREGSLDAPQDKAGDAGEGRLGRASASEAPIGSKEESK